MRNKILLLASSFLFMIAVLMGCEKPVFDEQPKSDDNTPTPTVSSKDANVILSVKGSLVYPYEKRSVKGSASERRKAVQNLVSYCTRLNFVVYKDGQKVKGLSQQKEIDSDFGQVNLRLESGTYTLLVLAHSSMGGNPTLSDYEHIQFTNALSFSDTFWYFGTFEATETARTHELVLERVSSLIEFTIVDELPANLATIQFDYTGGTGVLNGATGYGGDVNSRQAKRYGVAGYESPLSLNLYTFLRSEEGYLNITATAMTAQGDTIKQRVFENVPVARKKKTVMEGEFFEHDNDLSIKGETDWEIHQTITY